MGSRIESSRNLSKLLFAGVAKSLTPAFNTIFAKKSGLTKHIRKSTLKHAAKRNFHISFVNLIIFISPICVYYLKKVFIYFLN